MKFELKTDNNTNLNSFSPVLKTVSFLTLLIILFNVALKLGSISRYYQVNYSCRLLSVEKSKSNFKKLSRLSNLKSKQKIWEFCREVFK